MDCLSIYWKFLSFQPDLKVFVNLHQTAHIGLAFPANKMDFSAHNQNKFHKSF